MPCHSTGFRCVHTSSERPSLQGFWFMRVHSESQEFKIFADGNADTRRIDPLISNAIEMVQRADSRRAPETTGGLRLRSAGGVPYFRDCETLGNVEHVIRSDCWSQCPAGLQGHRGVCSRSSRRLEDHGHRATRNRTGSDSPPRAGARSRDRRHWGGSQRGQP